MNPRILIVALLAVIALLIGFTFHFSAKASAMEKERREAAESLLALQDSTQTSGKEKDAALGAARAQHDELKSKLDVANVTNTELASQVAKLKESAKDAESMRDAAAKLGKENAELRKQLEATRAEAKAAVQRAERAERSAADASARSASAPAPAPATPPAPAPAAAAGGPSSFWWGKPYYGDLDLRQMMLDFHNPRLALDAQAVEYREARAELLRRGASVAD
jgi:small-conductance mechanosensitive channel